MTTLQRFAVLLLTVFGASAVDAAVAISPANPTSVDPITAFVSRDGLCAVEASRIVLPGTVRVTMRLYGCVGGPPPFTVDEPVPLGSLPAGSYTLEVYEHYDPAAPAFREQFQFSVAPSEIAAVPVTTAFGRSLYIVITAIVAVLVLRRAAV